MFISKYTSGGQHVKTTGFGGISKYPFNRGNCHAALHGDMLVCNYSGQVYQGYRSNDVIAVRISDMTKALSRELESRVGQSHDQRVLFSKMKGCFVFANQGDSYPRGFEIAFPVSGLLRGFLVFHFYLQANVKTDMSIVGKMTSQLGGLVETRSGIALVGASAKSISEASKHEPQNLFIQILKHGATEVCATSFVTSGTRVGATSDDINDKNNKPLVPVTDHGVMWLTDYSNEEVYSPQVVVTDDDRLVIIWEKHEVVPVHAYPRSGLFIDTHYIVLSGRGDIVKEITSLGGVRLNAFEDPIFTHGVISWASVCANTVQVHKLDVGPVPDTHSAPI
jgi:hypothetical protein